MTFNFRIGFRSNELRLFQIDNCSSIEGPILVPGKDRFLWQRCGAQFVSVRATRFLAAKAVTGSCTPGDKPTSPAHSIFNPKTTMYKNIIKLAAIAAKDTPSAIMKKIKKLDPRFAQERDLEIESYLSRKTSLNFPDSQSSSKTATPGTQSKKRSSTASLTTRSNATSCTRR